MDLHLRNLKKINSIINDKGVCQDQPGLKNQGGGRRG